MEIDKAVGNNFWGLTIQKDMDNTRIAFEKDAHTVEDMRDVKVLPGYQDIGCRMTFDNKTYRNFTRKARFVAGGCTNDLPESITYSSVVYMNSVRIAFILAELNDIDVFAVNIGYAYFNSSYHERF